MPRQNQPPVVDTIPMKQIGKSAATQNGMVAGQEGRSPCINAAVMLCFDHDSTPPHTQF